MAFGKKPVLPSLIKARDPDVGLIAAVVDGRARVHAAVRRDREPGRALIHARYPIQGR